MNEGKVYREFDNLQDASHFRRTVGTGGWIFQEDKTGRSTIFPYGMTPTAIMTHPLTHGQSGKLHA